MAASSCYSHRPAFSVFFTYVLMDFPTKSLRKSDEFRVFVDLCFELFTLNYLHATDTRSDTRFVIGIMQLWSFNTT